MVMFHTYPTNKAPCNKLKKNIVQTIAAAVVKPQKIVLATVAKIHSKIESQQTLTVD